MVTLLLLCIFMLICCCYLGVIISTLETIGMILLYGLYYGAIFYVLYGLIKKFVKWLKK